MHNVETLASRMPTWDEELEERAAEWADAMAALDRMGVPGGATLPGRLAMLRADMEVQKGLLRRVTAP